MAGVIPARVTHPGDAGEAAETLAAARENGEAVVAGGGGTMLQIGDRPRRYTAALCTDRLRGIVEYNPGDLTIVVRAGTTLAEVGAELRPHGQYLSLEAPRPEHATIGGALAANATGPARLAHGTARDAVIGMRMALPSGQIARSGGRVVKNVAGYDLAKLFIGSFGTLGVIVEAAFKVLPIPQAQRVMVAEAPELAAAAMAGDAVARLGPGVRTVAVVNEQLAARLGLTGTAIVVAIGGTEGAVRELQGRMASLAGSEPYRELADDAGERLLAGLRDFPGRAALRVSGRNVDPGRVLAARDGAAALVYPAIGTTYLAAPDVADEKVAELRRSLARVGGQVTLWQGAERPHGVSTWGETGSQLALMRAVKSTFDPAGVMSPGRFVGGI